MPQRFRIPVLGGAALALTLTALLARQIRSGALGPAASAPQSGVSIVAACEAGSAQADAVAAAVAQAVAAHGPAPAHQEWRVHSVCVQGDQAYAYVKSYSPATGAPLPIESEVALAQWTGSAWQVTLPDSHADYNAQLGLMSQALVPASVRGVLAEAEAQPAPAAARPSGFNLPYPHGESAYVIWHWYAALDFSIGGQGVYGTVRNAKAGTAVFVKDSSTRECGDPPPDWYCWMFANGLVIQTGPAEYAWYLHLAANSIPDWIQEGVFVPAGADLGVEGATGWAVTDHVHFMVASAYSCCDGEGDQRIPHWPGYGTLRVNFNEGTWETLPFQAYSQNGEAPAPPPTSPPAPPPPAADLPLIADAPATPEVVQPPQPPPPAARCPNPYTVQRGDYLIRIAAACAVDFSALVAANPGLNPNRIFAGQQLNLPGSAASAPPAAAPPAVTPAAPTPPPAPPPPAASASQAGAAPCTGTHTVAPNENLFRIGFNCGFSLAQMAAANGIAHPYVIHPGQVLRFP
jgi:LysM repeat protein